MVTESRSSRDRAPSKLLGAWRRIPWGMRALFLLDLGLTVAYLGNAFLFDRSSLVSFLLDLDNEGSVPTWYSIIKLFAVGAMLGTLAFYIRGRMDKVRLWLAAALFAFLSKEESIGIHEFLHMHLAGRGLSSYDSWLRHSSAWPLILGPPLLIVMIVLGWRSAHILRGRPHVVRGYVVGLVLFLGGAVGVELLVNTVTLGSSLHRIEIAVEEFLEMAGVTFFLLASYRLLASYGIRLVVEGGEPEGRIGLPDNGGNRPADPSAGAGTARADAPDASERGTRRGS